MYLPLRQLSPGGTDSHLPFGRVFGVGRETHLLPRRIAMFASNLRCAASWVWHNGFVAFTRELLLFWPAAVMVQP